MACPQTHLFPVNTEEWYIDVYKRTQGRCHYIWILNPPPSGSEPSQSSPTTSPAATMSLRFGVVAALAGQAVAFPWVASHVGMDPVEMAERDALVVRQAPGSNVCPFNPDHRGAVPFNPRYPYCGAQNGAPGFQICANNRVPARV